jgi:dihydrofolate reductase
MSVRLLVAAARNDVIGRDGDLPWRLPADLKRFAALTRGHAVVMGRRTYDSILARLGRPLPGRHSVVVSTTLRDVPPDVEVARSPAAAAARAAQHGPDDWFVVGGASVYAALLPAVDVVDLTRVHADVDGDARMPAGWLDGFRVVSTEPGPPDGADFPFDYVRLERA